MESRHHTTEQLTRNRGRERIRIRIEQPVIGEQYCKYSWAQVCAWVYGSVCHTFVGLLP